MDALICLTKILRAPTICQALGIQGSEVMVSVLWSAPWSNFQAKEIPKCAKCVPPFTSLMLMADITNQSQQSLSLNQAETFQFFSMQHSGSPCHSIGVDLHYTAYLLP